MIRGFSGPERLQHQGYESLIIGLIGSPGP